VSCRSLDSSNSSFFSLANSTGFCSPMNDGSGQRSLFSATADGVAARLFGSGPDYDGNGGLPSQDVPIAYPKANRPRPSQTPSLASGPSFITMNTRGATQRHHIAFSDSPPPREAGVSRLLSFGGLKPVAKSAESAFHVPSPLTKSGCPRDGLFTSFGQGPSLRLAGKETSTEGSAQLPPRTHPPPPPETQPPCHGSKSYNGESTELGRDAGATLASEWPKPPSSVHAENGLIAKHATSSLLLHGNAGDSVLSSADRFVRADDQFGMSPSERNSGGGVSSLFRSEKLRASKSSQHLSSASAGAPQAHRYQEANDEAGAAATHAPLSDSTRNGARRLAADTADSASPQHTVVDATNRSDRPHHPVRLSAEKMSTLKNNLPLRRTSVSASPFVPEGWRPAVREQQQRPSTSVRGGGGGTAALSRAAGTYETTDESCSAMRAPARATFTTVDDRSPGLLLHSHYKAVGPQKPSVRFIYTRSGSTSKAVSPDRSMLATPGESDTQASPKVAGTTPAPAATAAAAAAVIALSDDKKQHVGEKAAPCTPALSTLPRNAVPSQMHQRQLRCPAASVPFSRSATFAGVSERESKESRPPSATDGYRRRRRSLVQDEPVQVSSGRGSRGSQGSATDFDAAPQSYLEKWRQRQVERKAREAEAAQGSKASSKAVEKDETAAEAAAVGAPPSGRAETAKPPPSAAATTGPAVEEEEAMKPQLSAPATNASGKRMEEEPTNAVAALADGAPAIASAMTPSNTNETTLKKSANVSTSTEVSPGSRSAYSLSEALRSSSLPDTTSVPQASEGAPADPPTAAVEIAPAVASVSAAAAPPGPPVPLNEKTLNETLQVISIGGRPTTVATSSPSPHPRLPSDVTFFSAASAVSNRSGASPHPSSGQAQKASPVSSGSYQMEDYVRRASVEEDIPEDQLCPATSLTAPSGQPTATPAVAKREASPRRASMAGSDHGRDVVCFSPAETPAQLLPPPLASAVESTSAPAAASSRRSTVLPSPALETTQREGEENKDGASTDGDMRELLRSVLERREQRLQRQQQQEKVSARRMTSERATPQLRIPTQSQQPPHDHLHSSLTVAPACDTAGVTRSSTKLNSGRGYRTILSTPYTPSWEISPGGGASLNSRPPSITPEPVETATTVAVANAAESSSVASTATTLPLSHTRTLAVEHTHPRPDSLLSTATSAALQKGVLPSESPSPSSGAVPPSTMHDGRSSVAAAAAVTDTDDAEEDGDLKSSRISQLLARRSSFASRLSHGGDAASPALPSISFTQIAQHDMRKEPPLLSSADRSSLPGESAVASARGKEQGRASVPPSSSTVSEAVVVSPGVLNMAAALESIPTAADIERDARMAAQYALDTATASPDEVAVSPHQPSERPEKKKTMEPPPDASAKTAKVNSDAAEKPGAPTSIYAVEVSTALATPVTDAAKADPQLHPKTSFAARPLTSPVEAKAAALCSPPAAAPKPGTAAATTTPKHQKPTPAKSASPVTALGEIHVDELDRLEESIDALLKTYGKSAAAATTSTGTTSHHAATKGETPSKMTAADILLSQMPLHVPTRAEKKKAASAAAAAARHSKSTSNSKTNKLASMELSGSSSRHHGSNTEWEDEDSHWDASVLWCGEESDGSERVPPTCVPPLDLTALQLPTGAPDDLKPYRIPLPTAVPVPEENRLHLMKLAGMLPSSSSSPENAGHDGSGRSSLTLGGRDSGTLTGGVAAAASFRSPHPNKSTSSTAVVSPFLGERIRCMKEQPPEPPVSLAAARKLRLSRLVSRTSGVSADSVHRPKSSEPLAPPLETSEEEDGGEAEDSIHELVDEAPQRVSRVVRFTDDSDALDGGRGAARDIRVGQQKIRVRMVLLDCEEQRERKVLLAEEQSAFTTIVKSYRRSSLLT
jgi:hypothetical protein